MTFRRCLMLSLALAVLSPCPVVAGDALASALTRQMALNRQRYGIAGQAVLVAHDGKVIFRGVDGEADVTTHERLTPGHVFRGYSLSKLFVSTLILQLVEQGRVDLDQPADSYLSGLPQRWRTITVRDFLDHTSGVPEYFDPQQGEASSPPAFPADEKALFTALAEKPLQFAPGTDVRYTQTNYVVLAALLAAHYGKPYAEVARERIVRRLVLRHTWLGPAALPRRGVATSYLGKNGRLERDADVIWPAYAYSHAELYLTLDDLARFLQAVNSGELVKKSTLNQFWKPRLLPGGRRGWFAAGWEYGESGTDRQVGHGGGARDRVRIVFNDSPNSDTYIFIYLTNGSSRNVWTRRLVGSAMAVVAPDRFPLEALQEILSSYALREPADGDVQAEARSIRAGSRLSAADLERAVNDAGYGIRENLGLRPALRVFALNTVLFPDSANTWDSLAEAHAANGDAETAKALYDKARGLSVQRKADKRDED